MIQRSFSYRRVVVAGAIAVAATGVFAVASSVAARTARDESQNRPIILLLHGRGQLGRDTTEIRAEWQHALETGVSKLTQRPVVGPDDVRLIWYADILDPASSAGCDSDRRAQARRTGADDGDVLQLLLGVTSTLFTSLYESMPAESRFSMRALVGDMLYLGDPWKRCGVEQRLESALAQATREGRPIVLVAHSFGSLVAYSYLRAARTQASGGAPMIHRYVTLGSMLGIPELQELVLGRAGPISLPTNVQSWVNVRHVGDPFAAPLADTATDTRSTRIREVVTSVDAVDPHDIVSYLRDPATARAVTWAWCGAGGKAYSPACSDIGRDIP